MIAVAENNNVEVREASLDDALEKTGTYFKIFEKVKLICLVLIRLFSYPVLSGNFTQTTLDIIHFL